MLFWKFGRSAGDKVQFAACRVFLEKCGPSSCYIPGGECRSEAVDDGCNRAPGLRCRFGAGSTIPTDRRRMAVSLYESTEFVVHANLIQLCR